MPAESIRGFCGGVKDVAAAAQQALLMVVEPAAD